MYSLALDGQTLIVGGNISSVVDWSANALLKVNAATGEIDMDWLPTFNDKIRKVMLIENSVYVLGDFTSVNELEMHQQFVRIELNKFDNKIIVTDIPMEFPDQIFSGFTVDEDYIYISRHFDTGEEIYRIERGSHFQDNSWDMAVAGTTADLKLVNGYLYVVGEFAEIAGSGPPYTVISNAFRIDINESMIDPSWAPIVKEKVYTLEKLTINGVDYIAIGGAFTQVNNQPAIGMALLDINDGALNTAVNLSVKLNNGIVHALVPSENQLILGGVIKSINSIYTGSLYRYDNNTLLVDESWHPNVNGPIHTIEVIGNDMYIAGYFTAVGSTAMHRLAKLDMTTGSLNPNWSFQPVNFTAGGYVDYLKIHDDYLYIGGQFTNLAGKGDNNLARVSTANTGVIALDESWQPNPNARITALEKMDGYLYVGGNFTNLMSSSLHSLIRFSLTDASLDET